MMLRAKVGGMAVGPEFFQQIERERAARSLGVDPEWMLEVNEAPARRCFGCGGGNTETINSSSSPPPQFTQAFTSLLGQAQNVAAQPLQQYSGPLVAGFTPAQTAAFDTINNSQGIADPYINSAAQYAAASTTPIQSEVPQYSGAAISGFESPYTADVVNSTEAQFNNQNAQQQAGLTSQAASQGALGGDRLGVAQGVMAGQQASAEAPVIAGLENTGFTNAQGEFNTQQSEALNAATADAWLNSQAGFQMGNLGNEAQNTTLTGANAQLGIGNMEQTLAQEGLNIPYEQFEQAQAYPFQTTSYLGGLETGLGSSAGGTSSTTQPGPSELSSLVGAGALGTGILGATGAFGSAGYLAPLLAALRRGGGVPGFDAGGPVVPAIPDLSISFVPSAATGNRGAGPPRAPNAAPQQNPAQMGMSALSGLSNIGKTFPSASAGASKNNSPAMPGMDPSLSPAAAELGIEEMPFVSDAGAAGISGPSMGMYGARRGGRVAGFAAGGRARVPDRYWGGGFIGGFDPPVRSRRTSGFKESADGGAVGLDDTAQRFDAGGAPLASVTPLASAGPNVQNYAAMFANLPTEKLQELAVRMPPTSPQGQLVQRALTQRKINPAAAPAGIPMSGAPTAGMAPSVAPGPSASASTAAPLMQPATAIARGGNVRRRAAGGPTVTKAPGAPGSGNLGSFTSPGGISVPLLPDPTGQVNLSIDPTSNYSPPLPYGATQAGPGAPFVTPNKMVTASAPAAASGSGPAVLGGPTPALMNYTGGGWWRRGGGIETPWATNSHRYAEGGGPDDDTAATAPIAGLGGGPPPPPDVPDGDAAKGSYDTAGQPGMRESAVPPNGADSGIESNKWFPLIAAGAGMMAGRSHFAGQNIGAGLLEGVKTAEHQGSVDVEAKKLADAADFHRDEVAARDKQTAMQQGWHSDEVTRQNTNDANQAKWHQQEVDLQNRRIGIEGATAAATAALRDTEAKRGNMEYVGNGTGPDGKPAGIYIDRFDQTATPHYGPVVTSTAKSNNSFTGGMVSRLIDSGVAHNEAEAMAIIRDPTGANAAKVRQAQEGLASENARSDPGYQTDPVTTANKWRTFYHLPPIGTPSPPTPGTPPGTTPASPPAPSVAPSTTPRATPAPPSGGAGSPAGSGSFESALPAKAPAPEPQVPSMPPLDQRVAGKTTYQPLPNGPAYLWMGQGWMPQTAPQGP